MLNPKFTQGQQVRVVNNHPHLNDEEFEKCGKLHIGEICTVIGYPDEYDGDGHTGIKLRREDLSELIFWETDLEALPKVLN